MPSAPVTRLPDLLVDQIAAGEVIERPAAVVKELVENALDAGARRIVVSLVAGGTDRVAVSDDGAGMGPDDLALAVQRHCTSKLAHRDLDRIETLGFRGEALPSIGAAARLTLVSRRQPQAGSAADGAWRIAVAGGIVRGPEPCAGPPGTTAVVEDLFFATPARRKFLKSVRQEAEHVLAVVRRLALASPAVALRLEQDGATVLDLPSATRAARVAAILDASDGLHAVSHTRGSLGLEGTALHPAVTRSTNSGQFLVVNGRPVADPVLRTAVRVAYRHGVERGRHPVCALFLTIPPDEVDVNVHPAKTELRFRDPDAVRALVIGGLARALGAGPAAGLAGPARAAAARPYPVRPPSVAAATGFAERPSALFAAVPAVRSASAAVDPDPALATDAPAPDGAAYPLGAPLGQILDTYVLAVADDGSLVMVDQHAAHERLTHERLLAEHRAGGVRAQALLLPAVVELPPSAARTLAAAAPSLAEAGLVIEGFGPGAVLVRAMPAALGAADPARLVRDLADELATEGVATALDDRVEAAIARLACHGSVRAGRRLGRDEMAALLRAIEREPAAATCPHGRPTVIRLTRDAIERMFGRA